jgi:hypothetical protein
MTRKKIVKKPLMFEGFLNVLESLFGTIDNNCRNISMYLDDIDKLILNKKFSDKDKLKRIQFYMERIRHYSDFGGLEFHEMGIELGFLEPIEPDEPDVLDEPDELDEPVAI